MKRVLTAVVLIPLVLLAVFKAPIWLLIALVGLVSLLATYEYLGVAAGYGIEPFRVLTLVLAGGFYALLIWLVLQKQFGGLMVVLFILLFFMLTPFLYLIAGIGRSEMRSAVPGAALSYFALPYIGFSLSCLLFMRVMVAGWFFILFTFLVVWVGDTAAYYVGKNLGKTKFAAQISPKKTWEGAIASVIGSIVIAWLLVEFAPQISQGLVSIHLLQAPEFFADPPLWLTIAIAIGINIAGQLGDLFESLIKRGANVKDSGTLLPGHGGVLDRIDALLFALPVALLTFEALSQEFLRLP